MMSIRSAWFAVVCAGATAVAQTTPIDLSTLVPLDKVVATVNDAVILNSEVLTLTAPMVQSLEKQVRRPVTREEVFHLYMQNLERKIDTHALAQAAKTLGIIPPDRVESFLQEQLRDEERDQIRELGTYQKLSEERLRQSSGSSWQSIVRDQRVSKLADLTRGLTTMRLQNQRNLLITPRGMRYYYRRHNDQFVHGSRALLGVVAVMGTDGTTTAAEIADAWRDHDLMPEELVRRFAARGACNADVFVIDDSSKKTRRADEVAFALAGPAGSVSAPIEREGSYRVWKVLEYLPQRNDPFDDADVQREIRDRMEREVIDQLMLQTVKRARERTQVWRLDR
jgi:hypothetical protein